MLPGMGAATFTIDKASPKFPAGTTVGAYDALRLPGGDPANATSAIPVTASQVGANGSLTLTGLDFGRRYFAVAVVAGRLENLAFSTPADPSTSAGSASVILEAARQSAQAMIDEVVAELAHPHELRLRAANAVTVPNANSTTYLAFALEELDDPDNDQAPSGSPLPLPQRVRCRKTGSYLMVLSAWWEPNIDGARQLQLVDLTAGGAVPDGLDERAAAAWTLGAPYIHVFTTVVDLVAGHEYGVLAMQSSGGGLDVQAARLRWRRIPFTG